MGRANTNAKRSALKPGPICVDSKDGKSKVADSAGGGATKQFTQTGKKYNGPNYPDKGTGIVYTKEI